MWLLPHLLVDCVYANLKITVVTSSSYLCQLTQDEATLSDITVRLNWSVESSLDKEKDVNWLSDGVEIILLAVSDGCGGMKQ